MTVTASRDRPVVACVLITLACLFWASVFVLGRGTRDTIPPMALTVLRHVVSIAVLLPFAWGPLRSQWRLALKALPWITVLGIMAIGLFPALLLLALGRTTALNGSLINSVQPVMTMALAYLVYREPAGARQVLGIAASLGGVLVIITGGNPLAIGTIGLNVGDLVIVLCLFLWSLYSIGLRHIPPVLHPNILALGVIACGLPFSVPFFVIEASAGHLPSMDWPTAATIVYFGVFPSALALLFWNRGVAALGPNRSGVFIHLIPVFGALMAIGLLGEEPRGFHAIGIAFVVVGIALTTTVRRSSS